MDSYFLAVYNLNQSLLTVVLTILMFIGLWVIGYYLYKMECWCLKKPFFGRRIAPEHRWIPTRL